jgi:tRNA 2-thiouridine synthesizing protein E
MVQLDPEGYLINPDDWTHEVARKIAENEKVKLEDDHWPIIEFMRRYYEEHRVAADARFVIKHMTEVLGHSDNARHRLFELFPYGYVQQACKISGMKKPRGWSSG